MHMYTYKVRRGRIPPSEPLWGPANDQGVLQHLLTIRWFVVRAAPPPCEADTVPMEGIAGDQAGGAVQNQSIGVCPQTTYAVVRGRPWKRCGVVERHQLAQTF